MATITFYVPECAPGDVLTIPAPDGVKLKIRVPGTVRPGDRMYMGKGDDGQWGITSVTRGRGEDARASDPAFGASYRSQRSHACLERVQAKPEAAVGDPRHALFGWCANDASWKRVCRSQTSAIEDLKTPSQMKVMTYNVWFDKSHKAERFSACVDIIKHEYPDVVALQEMTPEAANWLMTDPTIRDRYWMTSPRVITLNNSYGLLTLVSRTLSPTASNLSATYHDFGDLSPLCGRGVQVIVLQLAQGATVALGNTHLESPIKGVLPEHREAQLQCSARILSETSRFLCMGDFNFCSEDETRAIHDLGLNDVWLEMNPDDTTATFDWRRNRNVNQRRRYVSRPDRIISSSGWTPTEIRLVGEDIVSSIGVPPSDHFGIIATMHIH